MGSGGAGRRPRAGPLRALAGWALVSAAVIAGLLLADRGSAGAEQLLDEGVPARGERLYTLQCAVCHAPDGRGGLTPDGRRAPAVDDVSIAYARVVLQTHRMPPGEDPFDNRLRPRRLDRQDMADVLAFMVERFDLTGDVEAPEPGDPARGLELYSYNCAACHGATGAGGVAGRGAFAPPINHYGPQVVADAVRVGPFEMPRFGRDALTDEDVGDIIAFLQTTHEEPGTLLFPGELNPVFASGFGALLVLAVLALVGLVAGKPVWIPDPEGEEHAEPDAAADQGHGGEEEDSR